MRLRSLAIGASAALLASPLVLLASSAPPASAALPAISCNIVVPPAPLSAAGLATPYVLEAANGNGCTEADAGFTAFVQAAIVAPNGQITIYSPLVITAGTAPAAPPVLPVVPSGSTVGIWFGFNGVDLHLVGPGVVDPTAGCINGLTDSDFGQFAACNAPATFAAATALATTLPVLTTPPPVTTTTLPVTPPTTVKPVTTTVPVTSPTTIKKFIANPIAVTPRNAGALIASGAAVKTGDLANPIAAVGAAAPLLTIPPLGTELDGQTCPSTASYAIVDQDPADNVQSTYLANPTTGATAQNTAENRFTLPGDVVLTNPSDERLLSTVVDPAIGCHPWALPNAADPGSMVDSLFADQLQAAVDQAAPIADVELQDEMTLDGVNNTSPAKTELYRMLVDEPIPVTIADELTFEASNSLAFCIGLDTIGTAFLTANQGFLTGIPSPVAGANNLWLFLANRLLASMDMTLPTPGVVPTCAQITGIPDPITVTVTGGNVSAATVNAGGD